MIRLSFLYARDTDYCVTIKHRIFVKNRVVLVKSLRSWYGIGNFCKITSDFELDTDRGAGTRAPAILLMSCYRHLSILKLLPKYYAGKMPNPTFPLTRVLSDIVKRSVHNDAKANTFKRIYTLPNVLSLSRILCAPVVGYAVINDQLALVSTLIVATATTDWADGWIARKWKQESALGSWLDPLGDKLLVGALAASLLFKGQLPIWLALLILLRDCGLITVGIALRLRSISSPISITKFLDPAVSTSTVRPHLLSKINTGLQFLLFALTVVSPLLQDSALTIQQILPPLQWVVASTTIASGLLYFKDYRNVIKPLTKNKL